MKTTSFQKTAIAICLLFAIAFTSCEKSNVAKQTTEKGQVELSFSITDNDLKKSSPANKLEDVTGIILTIQKPDGSETKYTDAAVKIFKMGEGFTSEKVLLPTGDYELAAFTLVNDKSEILFATPMIGSLQAQNVSTPLEIPFAVEKNEVTDVPVEVLSTSNSTPTEFGYARFNFKEIKTFSFLVNVTEKGKNEFLSTKLTVMNGTYTFEQSLGAVANNQVTIKDELAEGYTLKVQVAGYNIFEQTFTREEMKAYETEPLNIELEKNNIPTEGLLAYFPFNGNANDESGKGNNGTTFGATLTTDRHGVSNGTYNFKNEGDRVELPVIYNDPTKDLTISSWVYSETPKNYGFIFSENNLAENGLIKNSLFLDNDIIRLFQFVTPDYTSSGINANMSTEISKWVHIAVVKKDMIYHYYKNGKLIHTSEKQPASNGVVAKMACIGSRFINNKWQQTLIGNIDDVRLYNRALSAEEISALYSE